MKRLLFVFLLIALAMAAQDDKKPVIAPHVQKLFILKYADPQQLLGLVRVFDASATPNTELHALAVEASPEAMAAIEDALKRLDVPPPAAKNVELRVDLLMATEGANPVGNPVPKDLDGVMTQLKNAFSFKSYGLLDVLTMRTRTGQQVSSNSAGGAIQSGARQANIITQFQVRSITVGGDGGSVRIDGLYCDIRFPLSTGPAEQFEYRDLSLRTDLDIKDGQKVVVGRMGIGHDQAIFLVLTVKVL